MPETAIAVANTTPCELNIEAMFLSEQDQNLKPKIVAEMGEKKDALVLVLPGEGEEGGG